MNEGLTASHSRFHEAPLVGFSALVCAGAGLGATHLVFAAFRLASYLPPPRLPGLITFLYATGLLVSWAHLGRPQGMISAFRGAGRSALSNEVLVIAVALGVAMVTSLLPISSPLFAPAWILTLLVCLATLLAMGLVYRIPGRPGWGGAVVFQPLTMGVIVGWIGLSGMVPGPRPFPFSAVLGAFVLVDLGITLARMVILGMARSRATPVHRRFFRARHILLLARGLMVDLLPLQLVVFGYTRAAILLLSVGVLLDRLTFYGLAMKETTEAEVGRVEAMLARELG